VFALKRGLPNGACCQIQCAEGYASSTSQDFTDTTISFNCKNGRMVGDEECVRASRPCTKPPTFGNNQDTSSEGSSCLAVSEDNPLTAGETCTVDCLPGFAASDSSGQVNYTCKNDGTFETNPSSQCICRGQLPDVEHYDKGVFGVTASDYGFPSGLTSDQCCSQCWLSGACSGWGFVDGTCTFLKGVQGDPINQDPNSLCDPNQPKADITIILGGDALPGSAGAGPCTNEVEVLQMPLP
jgi:hypothetical protein